MLYKAPISSFGQFDSPPQSNFLNVGLPLFFVTHCMYIEGTCAVKKGREMELKKSEKNTTPSPVYTNVHSIPVLCVYCSSHALPVLCVQLTRTTGTLLQLCTLLYDARKNDAYCCVYVRTNTQRESSREYHMIRVVSTLWTAGATKSAQYYDSTLFNSMHITLCIR